jgi:hypothetical protein
MRGPPRADAGLPAGVPADGMSNAGHCRPCLLTMMSEADRALWNTADTGYCEAPWVLKEMAVGRDDTGGGSTSSVSPCVPSRSARRSFARLRREQTTRRRQRLTWRATSPLGLTWNALGMP